MKALGTAACATIWIMSSIAARDAIRDGKQWQYLALYFIACAFGALALMDPIR